MLRGGRAEGQRGSAIGEGICESYQRSVRGSAIGEGTVLDR